MIATAPDARPGWAKYAVLFVLAACGLGGGLYLADGPPEPPPPTAGEAAPPTVPCRFALSAADAKDTLEAPTLATDAGGRVYLAWASRTGDDERTLYLASSDDGGRHFAPTRAVARSGVFKAVSQMKGKTVTRELRMVPHLVAAGPALHLAWTETVPGGNGVRMAAVESRDRGDTFGAPAQVHQGAGARPTFTALTAGPDGSLLASWLDNRNKAQQCFAAVRPAGAAAFEPEVVVHTGDDDKGVCPCCPTASLIAPDGTAYVAFRNVANGYRDIALGVKRLGASSFDVVPVITPTWAFNGCPHDGPSLALVGDTLHVAWMDSRTGSQRCYHASARRSDLKFAAQELNAGAGGTQGNAKLFADATGTLHAVWEESSGAEPAPAPKHQHEPVAPTVGAGGGRAIMHRAMPPGAAQFGAVRAVAPKAGAFQTRPAITGTPTGEIVVAWNELDESGKAVTVVPLAGAGAVK
ncbi:hypothetical protein R5W24_003949 [Gemmata sp. JC717]|uniref:hypothetical protein n=1 Tax=Gemmata algarum TaxID=2975278 RepID=UPI0021BB72A7|nr:hypothetical protein [Gemmata algarum]MDY3554820.1 hypothetical protein [Gemmata algarum]